MLNIKINIHLKKFFTDLIPILIIFIVSILAQHSFLYWIINEAICFLLHFHYIFLLIYLEIQCKMLLPIKVIIKLFIFCDINLLKVFFLNLKGLIFYTLIQSANCSWYFACLFLQEVEFEGRFLFHWGKSRWTHSQI